MCVLQLKIYTSTLKLRWILEIFICYLKSLSAEPATKYQPPKSKHAQGAAGWAALQEAGSREPGVAARPAGQCPHPHGTQPHGTPARRAEQVRWRYPRPPTAQTTRQDHSDGAGPQVKPRDQDQEGTMIGTDTAAMFLRQWSSARAWALIKLLSKKGLGRRKEVVLPLSPTRQLFPHSPGLCSCTPER